MNNLINKSALRKDLSALPSENGYVRKSDVMQILGEQKCAYDPDKVVAQLEEYREEMEQFKCGGMLSDMIEVVKGGGVDEMEK